MDTKPTSVATIVGEAGADHPIAVSPVWYGRGFRPGFSPRRFAASFPTPGNETDRLAALRALNIVDSAPEAAYDDIAAEAKP